MGIAASATDTTATPWTPPDAAAMNEIAPPPPPPTHQPRLKCDLCSLRQSSREALFSGSPPPPSRFSSPPTPCTSSSSRAWARLPSPPPCTSPINDLGYHCGTAVSAPGRVLPLHLPAP
ncbi:uncharacterized protein LOC119381448 [Rhipicephalus sanguineus]|uniref:uncharacterized protein LOC119381448 n=1 Tax=Rhipicephalus sanguineus TaxID=34632 RepID=UPI0018960394|nr:uncharacterized protein LOC119381448 [Rhipicephalus sanguineus]